MRGLVRARKQRLGGSPRQPAALAGQGAPQDPPRATFRTEANYVRVDVYPTASDGTALGDLRRDEFQLLEDRVRQSKAR
jgi:hypothetical protein